MDFLVTSVYLAKHQLGCWYTQSSQDLKEHYIALKNWLLTDEVKFSFPLTVRITPYSLCALRSFLESTPADLSIQPAKRVSLLAGHCLHRITFCKVSVSFVSPGCWVSRNLAIVGSQTFLCPQTGLAVSQMCLSHSVCNVGSICTHAVCPSVEVLVLQLLQLLESTQVHLMAHKVPATNSNSTGTLASNVTDCKVTQYFSSASYKSIKDYPSVSVQIYSFTCLLLQWHF